MRRRALLLLAAALPGCTLVDQRTFNPEAGRPPERPKPPVPLASVPETGPAALLLIRLPVTAQARSEIARAVAEARRRKPGVVFDVVEVTGEAGVATGAEAAEVARLITGQGVPAARVHLAARPVPNGPHEVRVYVR